MRNLTAEFEGADLGDARLTKRLRKVVSQAGQQPGATFPKMMADDAELEGLYRLLGNEDVEYEAIAAVHRGRTAERAARENEVLVVHDTTTFQFAHAAPEEVGYLQTGKPGFYAHVSLVVSADGTRRPLGVANLETVFREKRSQGRGRNRPGSVTAKQPDRESKRWDDGVRSCEELLAGTANVIHVADREADSYSLLGLMHNAGCHYVIRVRHPQRRARELDDEGEWSTIGALSAAADACLEREVPISSRDASTAPRQSKAYPARETRMARLAFASTSMVIRRPAYLGDELPEEITINVVRVYEEQPPEGEEPIEWLLSTTEAVATKEEIGRVVDIYRARWLIEEFFKALKSGCIYEERQLETRRALLNALAIFLPIACQLLWMRAQARLEDTPAEVVLTKRQLKVLRAIARRPVPEQPTARQALYAIAGLGGHIKNNGEPGWAVLRRGLEALLLAEVGWIAATSRLPEM